MLCPLCNVEMKLIPAGVSKTSHKPYGAFYSCPECKNTLNTEGIEVPKREVIMQPVPVRVNGNDPYVDGKKENTILMCRKDLMVAVLDNLGGSTEIDKVAIIFNQLWETIIK
jgi:hypothetical protein